MRTISGALCALVLGSASGAHADYSWELVADVGHISKTSGDDFPARFVPSPGLDYEYDLSSVSATYFLDPVQDDGGPAALAAFLDPATRVAISASREVRTAGEQPVEEIEYRDYVLSGEYLLPRSKWYAGGRYSRGDEELPASRETAAFSIARSTDKRGYGVVAGKYSGAGATRLELALGRTTIERLETARFCPLGVCIVDNTAMLQTTEERVSIDVMHVGRFESSTFALFGGVSELSARLVVDDGVPPAGYEFDYGERRAYSVGGELFPLAELGLRLGYTRFAGPRNEDDYSIDLGVSWFFRGSVGLELVLARDETDVRWRDTTDRFSLRVTGRF
jgi:hypothetical protein